MRTLVPTLVLVAVAAHSWAQVPAGGEFRVNAYTTANQVQTQPAVDADGSFIITWDGRQQGGDGPGPYVQRYAADGLPIGSEFRANASGPADRTRSAFGKDGSFLVTWAGSGLAPVRARLFLGDGTPAGPEFQVNVTNVGYQYRQIPTSLPNGEFVVTWYSETDPAGIIAARRIDAQGVPIGSEFTVSASGPARAPFVAPWRDGFVIVWRQTAGQLTNVLGRRFDAAGQPVGDYFQANTNAVPTAIDAAVVAAGSGAFVVVWNEFGYTGIRARLYTPQGDPVGADFRVDTPGGTHAFPHAAADRLGNFVVCWTLFQAPNHELVARRFDASGAPRGAEFSVNTYTTGNQVVGVPAADDVGNFVISWYGQGEGDSPYGSFAQRYGGLRPTAVEVDSAASPSSDGNHILEPGEVVDLRASWRNLNGAAQTFGSTVLSLTGPAGATYTIADGTAAYGTVAHGDTAACSDCFSVGVSAPSRPVTHWDAVAAESITPDAHGQRKGWKLHVGESFTDVPRTSPYYTFVESLLHNGVTGGCSASTFCAQGQALREQMPVFVLVAKEGAGYAPRPCTTPMFADVPASSPYCRWIEELARRGVVGGCGGGNYCASALVSREQMPVFVLRTLDPALDPPPCTTPMFSDVPAGSPYCRWIEELARRNVVGGCGGGRYCPSDPVTREQMGVFISVAFDLQLYGL